MTETSSSLISSSVTMSTATTTSSNSGPLIAYNIRPMLCLPCTIEQTPLPVVRLEPDTNLNVPPLNAWSVDVAETTDADERGTGTFSGTGSRKYGDRHWRFNTRPRDCFESLRLADYYVDAVVAGVDVVAEAETLKKLIATPFSKQPLSLIVHKIGKTLLLDNCAYLRNYSFTHSTADISPVAEFLNSKSECLAGTETGGNINTKSGTGSTTGEIIADMHRKMIAENLYNRSLAPLAYKTSTDKRTNHTAQSVRGDGSELPKMITENDLADPLENYPYTSIKIDNGKAELDAYGRIWNFYDLNMLVDVNLPIFGCKTNPCVTLHPKDLKHRPINFLTGVDLYLDQSMCNAPEALLCWHMGGYVQEYELIRTEDIPHLENSKFDPLVLRNVAENIVAFLQDKVTQEGHTYWLCHDKRDSDRDSMLRLWDLTPLCGNLLEDSTVNPFTLSVGILIYKVARNLMRRSARQRPKRIANAVFRLLNVCLGIIDHDRHPQVVACVYYLLANLYLSYGCDAVKRTATQEEELERNEPLWAYDDRWQREYGEEYAHYAAISIETLKKTRYTDAKSDKSVQLRTLPNCATTADCCKEALEHCMQGLRYMDLFDKLEQEAQLSGKPLPDPMSFIRDLGRNLDNGREEVDAMLKVDIRSVLFIRAGTAYRILADSSFILSRFGRTLRFARVGLHCCLAVLTLNAGLTSEVAQRNLATARALLPSMMCHIAEALGNIACCALPIRDQAKADMKFCYRDNQIRAQALACFKNEYDSSGDYNTKSYQQPRYVFDEFDSDILENENCNDAKEAEETGNNDFESRTQTCAVASSIPNNILKNCKTGKQRKKDENGKARSFSWAFPKTFHLPFLELLAISERASKISLSMGKKISPMSLFPPTAHAILSREQLARRLGNLKNCLATYHIQRLKSFVQRVAQKGPALLKETIRQYIAMDIGILDAKNIDNEDVMEPEQVVEGAVEAGKELLLKGVSLFNSVDDRINEAFLLSNIGQLYRLKLHCLMFFTDFNSQYDAEKEKNSVLQSIEYYQRALTTVADFQSTQFPLFESISKDLAGTYYMYGVRLQDNIQPGMMNCDSLKLSIEIREFLSRAQSAYTLIRDSSRCSVKMHSLANHFIVEIMLRFGKLAEEKAKCYGISGSFRKQKECIRQATEHYSMCLNDVLRRINSDLATNSSKNHSCIIPRECITALKAAIRRNKIADKSVRLSNAEARVKYARRSLDTLLVATLPIMRRILTVLTAPEEERKEFFEIDEIEIKVYREALHHFVQHNRTIVKDALQCLMERGNSAVLDNWKNIYRLLLQIQSTDEEVTLVKCLEQLIGVTEFIKESFQKL